MTVPADAVWLITGCSTGFGRAIAEQLLLTEARIVVTARRREQVEDLAASHPDRVVALALDVTDNSQIHDAVRRAEQKFGAIDVLVNNAGYGYLAAIEEGEEQDYRAMFETNVFGLIAMTRAVLPGMRARRRGHVVTISSMGGLVSGAGAGYYCSTKFAVEGISEALAAEAGPLGIGVTIVEPGPFRTDWAGRSLRKPSKPIEDYQNAIARRQEIAGYSGQQPGDPVRAATAIIAAVHAENQPLRLPLGAVALEMGRRKIAALQRNFDDVETIARGADYPQAQAAE